MSPPKQNPRLREKRIRQFLDAALTVYVRFGYNGADMDVVAQEAGLAKGLLYYYFNTKQELFRAVFDDTLDRASACSDRAFQAVSGMKPIDRLIGYLYEMYTLSKQDPRLLLFALRMPFDCAAVFGIQQWQQGARRSLAHRAALTKIISDGMVAGEIPGADASYLSGCLWTVFMSNLFDFSQMLANKGEASQTIAAEQFRTMTAFCMRGIGLEKSRWEPCLENIMGEKEDKK